jgi:hypothetical protein
MLFADPSKLNVWPIVKISNQLKITFSPMWAIETNQSIAAMGNPNQFED